MLVVAAGAVLEAANAVSCVGPLKERKITLFIVNSECMQVPAVRARRIQIGLETCVFVCRNSESYFKCDLIIHVLSSQTLLKRSDELASSVSDQF